MTPEKQLLLNLIGALIMGILSGAVAAHKGRSAVGWFFVGFLTGCIGLIIINCLGNLKEERGKYGRMEDEQRRLREQLSHERLKNDAFQSHMKHRVDAHDGAIGIDTRNAQNLAALPPGQPPPPPPALDAPQPAFQRRPRPAAVPIMPGAAGMAPPPVAAVSAPVVVTSGFADLRWFVNFGKRSSQALDFDRLREFFQAGHLSPDSQVRNSENDDWRPISEYPQLMEQLTTHVDA